MDFKISFLSALRNSPNLIFRTTSPVIRVIFSGKSFFTRFPESLYQACDSCSIWKINSIIPWVRLLLNLHSWLIFSEFSYVPGLSCRKSDSYHFHIEECDWSFPNGITRTFLSSFLRYDPFHVIFIRWMEWFFVCVSFFLMGL
jgi:hypothetical protein